MKEREKRTIDDSGFITVLHKETEVDPIVGTFKLNSWAGNELGDDFYELVLDEDCYVMTFYNDGTYEEESKDPTHPEITFSSFGVWVNDGEGHYSLTVIIENETVLYSNQYVVEYELENNLLTLASAPVGYVTLNKAA